MIPKCLLRDGLPLVRPRVNRKYFKLQCIGEGMQHYWVVPWSGKSQVTWHMQTINLTSRRNCLMKSYLRQSKKLGSHICSLYHTQPVTCSLRVFMNTFFLILYNQFFFTILHKKLLANNEKCIRHTLNSYISGIGNI